MRAATIGSWVSGRLQSFCFDPIPEPTVRALVLLGGCMLMVLRKRNKSSQTSHVDSLDPGRNSI